jgi:putative ABC transport system permease protein
MDVEQISIWRLALGYGLLIFPLAVVLWYKTQMTRQIAVAVIRMTVQLLLVGLYLQVVFEVDEWWLTSLWLVVMITVADLSIVKGCSVRLSRFWWQLFIALALGTAIPLFYFIGFIIGKTDILSARFAIPVGGMILGNCLRVDIIGVRQFYQSLRKGKREYEFMLTQGASLAEAVMPFAKDAIKAALSPAVATMTTIGLVALPGMMTGVILGGADPATAIKYQIAIMLAIFSGTSITVCAAIMLTMRTSFDRFGVLDDDIFSAG